MAPPTDPDPKPSTGPNRPVAVPDRFSPKEILTIGRGDLLAQAELDEQLDPNTL